MKSVIAFSGGMDSATLLWDVLDTGAKGEQVLAVNFVYGSKHNFYERAAAKAFVSVTNPHRVEYREVDLTAGMAGFKSDLLKSGGDVPEGHYEAKSMERTVVPARNIIFASILAGIAWSEGADRVYLGVHAGDHAIYPDCRPEFVEAMQEAVRTGTGNKVQLFAPYLDLTKADILGIGLRLNVPYHLSRTCYVDSPISCGKCGSCTERREAFMLCGATDPIQYQYTGPLPPKPTR